MLISPLLLHQLNHRFDTRTENCHVHQQHRLRLHLGFLKLPYTSMEKQFLFVHVSPEFGFIQGLVWGQVDMEFSSSPIQLRQCGVCVSLFCFCKYACEAAQRQGEQGVRYGPHVKLGLIFSSYPYYIQLKIFIIHCILDWKEGNKISCSHKSNMMYLKFIQF